MSTHDRGAFGQLLAEAKELGCRGIDFYADFDVPDDSDQRWMITGFGPMPPEARTAGAKFRARLASVFLPSVVGVGNGRTGEEALRRLVEKLRASHTVGDGSDPK